MAGDHCPSPATFLAPYWATCAGAIRTAAAEFAVWSDRTHEHLRAGSGGTRLDCLSRLTFAAPGAGRHPPTLFLHGDEDDVVNRTDVLSYHSRLLNASVPTRLVTEPDKGHAWLDAAPTEVLAWIERWDAAARNTRLAAGAGAVAVASL
eukprot:100318-Prymnesium_polylepis.2